MWEAREELTTSVEGTLTNPNPNIILQENPSYGFERKITASARARISMRKVQTQARKDFSGSYIQSDPLVAVSTVPQTTHQEKDPPSSDFSSYPC